MEINTYCCVWKLNVFYIPNKSIMTDLQITEGFPSEQTIKREKKAILVMFTCIYFLKKNVKYISGLVNINWILLEKYKL